MQISANSQAFGYYYPPVIKEIVGVGNIVSHGIFFTKNLSLYLFHVLESGCSHAGRFFSPHWPEQARLRLERRRDMVIHNIGIVVLGVWRLFPFIYLNYDYWHIHRWCNAPDQPIPKCIELSIPGSAWYIKMNLAAGACERLEEQNDYYTEPNGAKRTAKQLVKDFLYNIQSASWVNQLQKSSITTILEKLEQGKVLNGQDVYKVYDLARTFELQEAIQHIPIFQRMHTFGDLLKTLFSEMVCLSPPRSLSLANEEFFFKNWTSHTGKPYYNSQNYGNCTE
jgi:hypothetical protein